MVSAGFMLFHHFLGSTELKASWQKQYNADKKKMYVKNQGIPFGPQLLSPFTSYFHADK